MKRARKKEKKINNAAVAKLRNVRFNTKRYFLVLGIVLAAAMVIGAILLGYDFSHEEVIPEDSNLVSVDLKKEGKINVLLLGVDVEGLRTDAIMVASYDVNEGKINLLSVPRDTRMYVGTRYQKINAAHAIGGMKGKIAGPEGSIEAVTRLTGIPIHYYIEFSFSAIDHFIDALGGVEFDVPDVEGKGRGMNYDDPVQNLHIHLKPGKQKLTGNQVQQLLRFRKSNLKGIGYADGDRGRVATQQEFVKELVKQKLTPGLILKVPDLYEQLKEDIKTNLTLSDITKYAGYLKDFKAENISAYQLPGKSNGTDYGASYWICDLEETKTLVSTVFGYDASKITIDSADGKSKSKDKKATSAKSKSSKTEKEEIPDNDKEEKEEKLKQANTPFPTDAVKETSKPTETAAAQTESPKPAQTPETTLKPEEKDSETEKTSKTPQETETENNETSAYEETTEPVSETAVEVNETNTAKEEVVSE